MERHGKSIRSVDSGHLSDNTEAVATISASRALVTTGKNISGLLYDPERAMLTISQNRFFRDPSASL